MEIDWILIEQLHQSTYSFGSIHLYMGCIRWCIQYAPTGLRSTSIDKEYYPCGKRGIWGGIFNMPLLGYDQLLPIKNTTYAESEVYAGAYWIRPYRMQNRCPKKGMITASAAWFRFRFPILVCACGTVQVSFPDYCPCMRNGSDFVFRFSIRTDNR